MAVLPNLVFCSIDLYILELSCLVSYYEGEADTKSESVETEY